MRSLLLASHSLRCDIPSNGLLEQEEAGTARGRYSFERASDGGASARWFVWRLPLRIRRMPTIRTTGTANSTANTSTFAATSMSSRNAAWIAFAWPVCDAEDGQKRERTPPEFRCVRPPNSIANAFAAPKSAPTSAAIAIGWDRHKRRARLSIGSF
jgi:hypothetical protein